MIISLLLSVSSCQRIQNIKNGLDVMSDSGKVLEKARQLFNDRDVDGLYDMFSVEAKKDDYLKDRIELLMYYYDLLDLDESQSKVMGDSGGKSVRDGVYTYFDDAIRVKNLFDPYGNSFFLSLRSRAVDKDNPENEGLYSISIHSHNSIVFGTAVDEKKVKDGMNVNAIHERIEYVLKRIEDTKKTIFDEQFDDEMRISKMRTLLEEIISEENKTYNNSIIVPESITQIESTDGIEMYPSLKFEFVDGSSFVIVVHTNT